VEQSSSREANSHSVKKFPSFYWTRRVITEFHQILITVVTFKYSPTNLQTRFKVSAIFE